MNEEVTNKNQQLTVEVVAAYRILFNIVLDRSWFAVYISNNRKKKTLKKNNKQFDIDECY